MSARTRSRMYFTIFGTIPLYCLSLQFVIKSWHKHASTFAADSPHVCKFTTNYLFCRSWQSVHTNIITERHNVLREKLIKSISNGCLYSPYSYRHFLSLKMYLKIHDRDITRWINNSSIMATGFRQVFIIRRIHGKDWTAFLTWPGNYIVPFPLSENRSRMIWQFHSD